MGAWKDPTGVPYGRHGPARTDRRKRDAWWRRQRKAAKKVLKDIDKPGTLSWAQFHGPDIVDQARIRHPEWFGGKPLPKGPSDEQS